MYCPNCGKKVSSSSKFCDSCGRSLSGLDSVVTNKKQGKKPWLAILIMIVIGVYLVLTGFTSMGYSALGGIITVIGALLVITAFVMMLMKPHKQQGKSVKQNNEPANPRYWQPKTPKKKPFTPQFAPTVPPQEPVAPKHEQPVASQPEPVVPKAELTRADGIYYFKDILTKHFTNYVTKENVPVTEIAGYANDVFQLYATRPFQAYKAEWGSPYTFGMYQNGELKALIMIGDGYKLCKKVKYLISRMYAKKCNVPYITFFLEAPNKKDYVVERINKYLNNN